MWIPAEETDPVLLHAPTRKHVGLFGAVRIADGKLVTRVEETLDPLRNNISTLSLRRALRLRN